MKKLIVIIIMLYAVLLGILSSCNKQDVTTEQTLPIKCDTVYYYKVIGSDTLLCINSVTIKRN
jgi:hypothetical protein